MFIAVLFMCLNNSCHVISSETIYKTRNECLLITDQEDGKNKLKFDVFESRCIEIKKFI
jgi:NADH:ubiquinone oxidoreductase subunit E